MEERIKELEKEVEILKTVCSVQEETIRFHTKAINTLIDTQKHQLSVNDDLFQYCKELRKHIGV